MNYDTSPVSIKKRKTRQNITRDTAPITGISGSKSDVAPKNEEVEASNTSETPVRKNGQLCESPQFMDFAESPEFRVGWDDGFGPAKTCDQIKLNENTNVCKKKTNRKVLNVRTLRTQRILSSTAQPETVNCDNEHPDSDEFLQWAQSLLCAPPEQDPVLESPKNPPSSKQLNQSLSANNGRLSPKPDPMKTPKRSVLHHSSPNVDSEVYKSLRKRSYHPTTGARKTPIRQESPLSKYCGESNTKSLHGSNNNGDDEFNEFFNDSVNELMILCSQAVESKLCKPKEKNDQQDSLNVSNLLDDSSNDLILQCTQQVEDTLFGKNKTSDSRASVKQTNSNGFTKNSENSNDKPQTIATAQPSNKNTPSSVNARQQFKQPANLHKLDCPSSIDFGNSPTGNVISSLNNNMLRTSFPRKEPASSPSPSLGSRLHEKGAKHGLSPNTKDEGRRKKFCHNNNEVSFPGKLNGGVASSDQDLTSILNEDEDMLSNLDIDEVLSQVPPIQNKPVQPYPPQFIHSKPTQPYPNQSFTNPPPATNRNPTKPFVPKTKIISPETSRSREPQVSLRDNQLRPSPNMNQLRPPSNVNQNQPPSNINHIRPPSTITFNGYKPNPAPTPIVSRPITVQETVPIHSVPQQMGGTDEIPKYTQEQIQMKKIEAKRRQALKIRRQKSFEVK